MKSIYKAAIRDLWFHKSRSIVIILAVILVTAFPIAFLDLPYNLGNVIKEEETKYGLGHLNIFYQDPTRENITEDIREIITSHFNITDTQLNVESRLHISSKMQAKGAGVLDEGAWLNTDIISIDPDNLPSINQVILTNGSYPETSTEGVMLESQAVADGIQLGDMITLYSFNGSYNVKIIGFIKSIEYSSYQLSQFGLVMMNQEGMKAFLGYPESVEMPITSSPILFNFDIENDLLLQISKVLKEELNKIDGIHVVLIWFARETSFRQALQDGLELTSRYMFAASIFIFLVAGVIIFVVMNRYVNEQKTTLGAMYSYGLKRRSIFLSYILKVAILSVIGVIFGLLLAKRLIQYLITDMANSWGLISIKDDFSTVSVTFTLISSTLVIYIFTVIAVANLLKLTPYEAMRGKTTELLT